MPWGHSCDSGITRWTVCILCVFQRGNEEMHKMRNLQHPPFCSTYSSDITSTPNSMMSLAPIWPICMANYRVNKMGRKFKGHSGRSLGWKATKRYWLEGKYPAVCWLRFRDELIEYDVKNVNLVSLYFSLKKISKWSFVLRGCWSAVVTTSQLHRVILLQWQWITGCLGGLNGTEMHTDSYQQSLACLCVINVLDLRRFLCDK